MMPAIGINVMLTGQTTQTVKNIDDESVLDFLVDGNLGEREPKDFWVEIRHKSNISYLANKTNYKSNLEVYNSNFNRLTLLSRTHYQHHYRRRNFLKQEPAAASPG